MATYKVLQDIEAEDKLVGPFTLRQFIYAAIAVINGFIAFKFATVNLLLISPFVPIIILFSVLAAPFGHDQPSEIWLLARVRYILKPHKRIWNQTGMVNLVTITAPKKIQRVLTKNLSQTEVRSRLRALANTIDSRGWAIKNVDVNLSDQSSGMQIPAHSDRLVDPSSLPQDVPSYDITAADDMLDPISNPTAQHLDHMIVSADQKHHQQVIASMNGTIKNEALAEKNPDYWFMNDGASTGVSPGYVKFDNNSLVNPGDDPSKYSSLSQPSDDAALLEQIEHNRNKSHQYNSHMHIIEPLSEQAKHPKINGFSDPSVQSSIQPSPAVTDPAIINQALANKDIWSIATQARQAEKAQKKDLPPDEVVISLH